jgi:dihydroorotase
MWCDHGFFVGAVPSNLDRLAELDRLPGCAGIKAFLGRSTGGLLVPREDLPRLMQSGNRRIAVHSEDEERLRARAELARAEGHPRAHPHWRDEETARLSTENLLRAAREHGRRVHVLHVTTRAELPLLAAHRDLATVEVTPQHLTLAAPECYEELGTLAQMNPPIRDGAHRAALWRAVQDGLVDVVGSDHAPHTREEKQRPYPESPSGMPGVQTLVPLLLDAMNAGRLTLQRFVDLTSAGPARVYGIARKGRIAVGYDADFTGVDLELRRPVTASWLASRCGWSPFEGRMLRGWPRLTVVRGAIVVREDEVLGAPQGAVLTFEDSLPATRR